MEHVDDDVGVVRGAEPPPTSHTPRSTRLRRGVLEVALIALGVFLGLMGEQWRESREHAQLAVAAMRRFRTEFQTNRAAVAAVRDRHVADLAAIRTYLKSDAAARARLPFPFSGTNPAFLKYAAWDLALATQSLSYVDPAIATDVAQVYAIQRQLDDATRDITQVMYANAGNPDAQARLSPFAVYFGDCTLIEPRLLAGYDAVLARLDRALGETRAR